MATIQGKWTKVEQRGVGSPGHRSAHAIAVVGNKLYLFGGEIVANQHIDKVLYVFDFKLKTWSIAPPSDEAPTVSCLGVRMVAVGTKLYVFGGRDEKKNFNDFYSYDTVTKEWKFLTKLDEKGGPEARTFHSMTSDDNHVYVFGGVSKASGTQTTPHRFRTIEAYNIAEGKWSQLPDPGEKFEKRGGAGFAAVNGKLWVVFGFATSLEKGGRSDYESNKVQYYDTVSKKWTEVETTGEKPTARSVFANAVIGKYIVIFGGEVWPDPNGHLGPGALSNEGYALDTETLEWTKLEVDEGDEPEMPVGWTANGPATLDGKQGLIMHGGKLPTNLRSDELYFYTF